MFRIAVPFLACLSLIGGCRALRGSRGEHDQRNLGTVYDWYTPPIQRSTESENFRFFVSLCPHVEENCEDREMEEMSEILLAIIEEGFMDLDVEVFSLEESNARLAPLEKAIEPIIPISNTTRYLARRNAGAYSYGGSACRRCTADSGAETTKKRRRRSGGRNRMLDGDPLDYDKIAARMTKALREELIDEFADDKNSCFFEMTDSDIQVRLQLMAHAGS